MNYQPVFEFFNSREAFLNSDPYRVAKGDREENLIQSATFRFSRYGGCLDGSLSTLYEMTTLVSEGDYMLARTMENGPAVYAGKIIKFNHRFMGAAEIVTYGFIKYFNDFTLEPEIFVGDFTRDAVGVLADRIRQNIKPYFQISQINSGTFEPDDISGARTFDVVAAYKSIRTEINRLAVVAGDVYFGFFDGAETGISDFNGSLPLLAFQVIQGKPPRGLRVSIGREAQLDDYSKNEDRIINSIHLYGATAGKSWVAENWESIKRHGVSRRWLQKPDLEDENQARNLLDYILSRGSQIRETYKIRLTHSDRSGDSLNFNERGIPFPWKERIQIMDLTGAALLSNQPAREMELEMGVGMAVNLTVGDNEGTLDDELEEVFGVKIEETPFSPQFVIQSTARETTSVYTSIPHPPIGFPLTQQTGTGLAVPSVTENRYNANRYFKELGDSSFQTLSETRGIPYCELFRILDWASAGSPEYFDLSAAVVRFCNYVDSNGDRQRWNQQNGLWDWAFRDWQTATPSYQYFVRKRFRKFLLDQNQLISAQQTVDEFPTDGTIFLEQITPGSSTVPYLISKQIPHSLSLHLRGTMKGTQDGASTAGFSTNFDWVYQTFGVWNHYVTRYPYSPTFSVPQTDRFPGSGFAYYFTPEGAAKAILDGSFWEPVISLVGTVPNPVDFGADETTGNPKWDIIDYLATDPFTRSLSGSLVTPGLETLPESTFTVKLDFVERAISDLTRISPNCHRSPLPSETAASQSYGLPRYQNWEWLVQGWDTDYSNKWR